ncbi:putative porin [Archangium gephyra]|uniref:hypothetical protein n=1 Tax=Archangium gephyra TaxID=48 RepID=UPI0035D503B2
MRKNNAKLVGVAVTALLGMSAWAGYKYDYTVHVYNSSDGAGNASGTLSGARNSPDSAQHIGCRIYSYGSGGNTELQCTAVSSNNVGGWCYSTDPALISLMQSIKGDSYISFYWNTSAKCTYVSVENSSYYAPKNP